MTVPMWSPFFLLAGVCWIVAPPRWMRRVNWPAVAALVYCLAVWAAVGLMVWWLVW